MHIIAAKAVALGEALGESFRVYQAGILENATSLSNALASRELRIVSGGTDNHLILVDVTSYDITGKIAEEALESAGLTVNKNTIPFDQNPPLVASGIRLGTPAVTTRGMGPTEMETIGAWIAEVLAAPDDRDRQARVREEVRTLCRDFPLYD